MESNQVNIISVEMVRDIFTTMFQKQQQDIVQLISSNLKITNEQIGELDKKLKEIASSYEAIQEENRTLKNNLFGAIEKIKALEKDKRDIEESLTVTQSLNEESFKKMEAGLLEQTTNRKEQLSIYEEKLRHLEDRQRRNNLRIDGLEESESESWDDTEKKVVNLFEHKLGLSNVHVERAHRTGEKSNGKKRTIVLKLLDYKDKVNILNNSKKLKGTGIYVNEDYSTSTNQIRANLFKEMKIHRENGKYAIVLYDRLVVREFKKPKNIV
ncbi:ankyrin repeat domain-containing protein 12-like [Hydractinia symbiolongicarpus]|uniref:ankyrin repeat domain-containing protein 12-like n=1 Tax=Hydractinia symbiolongicarpus TaxID=13093 RepID=UPI00254B91C2|nr:ankyrin repeat domain-containing protein 12-like [Hydractinia symbiolongicarpus]XP_057316800.1 ankyrin repeat domain-containing protein 12-like [Hydractinia symbiolongicarpus]